VQQQRRIALVAHDGRKQDMREWAAFYRDLIAGSPEPWMIPAACPMTR
jgi:methylglyoxal synthase